MKTVIITGAMGFIGGHTCKEFSKAGYHVIGIDREFTIPDSSQYINQLIIDDYTIVPEILKRNPVDSIIHIAGTSLVGPSIKDPGEYYNNNVAKTNQILNELGKAGWQGNFIFSSSAAVYGNNCAVPINEDTQGIPVSPYGHSKKMCEQVISDHTRAYGFKSIALRYFNACGCDSEGTLGNVWNDTHLIPRVVQNIIENEQIVINGNDFKTKDGTCVRDYLHVTDIANAHIRALELATEFDNGTFKAYNLGTGQGYSNLEIVQAIKTIAKQNCKITFGPRRLGDPDELVANPNSFIQDAKWVPLNSSLLKIVETTYNWMKKHEMVIEDS